MAQTNNNAGQNGGNAADSGKTSRLAGAQRSLGGNPVATLAGGFAVGALVGALLPASRREREALQPLAAKVGGAARDAVDTGREKIGRLSDEVVTQVRSTVDNVVAKAKEETGA